MTDDYFHMKFTVANIQGLSQAAADVLHDRIALRYVATALRPKSVSEVEVLLKALVDVCNKTVTDIPEDYSV